MAQFERWNNTGTKLFTKLSPSPARVEGIFYSQLPPPPVIPVPHLSVIPAHAGTQLGLQQNSWIPACAGMTKIREAHAPPTLHGRAIQINRSGSPCGEAPARRGHPGHR